jgi:hypothetical protein
MLLHLVCFKYKTEVDAETRRQHRERLAALKNIDGISDLRVGADVVKSARSYDTGLAITFVDRAALDAYQKHDRHVPVAQFGVGLCDHIVAVDFDVD